MGKLDCFKAKALALAQSGYCYGLPPLEFELSFEEGFDEAREWLDQPSTREELERLCMESRAKHKAAKAAWMSAPTFWTYCRPLCHSTIGLQSVPRYVRSNCTWEDGQRGGKLPPTFPPGRTRTSNPAVNSS